MKILFKSATQVLLSVVISVFLLSCGSPKNIDNLSDPSFSSQNLSLNLKPYHEDRVMVVAHRACWRKAPENSIASIESCIAMGVDMVELDVRETLDGHLILIHDKTLERTTNGSGLIEEKSLEQLSQLNLREAEGGEDKSVTNHKIPTLKEALAISKNRILINIDAKGDVREKAFLMAQKMGMENQILIKAPMSSMEDYELEESVFFGKVPFMPIVRESSGVLKQQISDLITTNAIAYEIIYSSEKQLKQACEEAKNQNARCWVNTMWERLSPGHSDDVSVKNPDKHWGALVRMGVNMFQTDRPEALISYLDSKGLH